MNKYHAIDDLMDWIDFKEDLPPDNEFKGIGEISRGVGNKQAILSYDDGKGLYRLVLVEDETVLFFDAIYASSLLETLFLK